MSNLQKRKEGGFTIIEVLIVLAIAGLIMLIVFLAVPALQRNSRNTQRKNDVSALLSGMAESVNNNSGTLPAAAANLGSGGTGTITGASGNNVDVKLGYYTADNVSITATVPASNTSTEEKVIIVEKAKCNGNVAVAGPSRGYVALYTVEKSSQQCQES